jgi:hypothetical protein
MNLRKEVRDLISLNEKLQSALLRGDHITDDEASVIRLCASELLEKVPEPQYLNGAIHKSPERHESRRQD